MDEYPFGLMPTLLGGGVINSLEGGKFRLSLPPQAKPYCDAQLDDTQPLSRASFKWRPPVKVKLRARASHPDPSGTLGFGFWNDPFTLSLGQGGAARKLPAAPQALWFFYGSPRVDLPLAPDIAGNGWKAASLCSPRIPSLFLGPLALAAIGLSTLRPFRSWIISTAIRKVHAEEVILQVPLTEWHTYSLEWNTAAAEFRLDGVLQLKAVHPPNGPLGFVLWIDNQYAVVNPKDGIRFGTVETQQGEWLEVEMLQLSSSS
jgi:hypothetical protein